MEVAEQQKQWQKEEETEEEMALQGRRSRKLAASAAAIGVSDASSGDEMLPISDWVNESREEESRQGEFRDGNTDSSDVIEVNWQHKPENDAFCGGTGEKLWPSLETIDGSQEQEELLLKSDNHKVELDSQQKSEKNVYYDQDEGTESISRYSETEIKGMRGYASEKNLGDDGLFATITKTDSHRDDTLSGFGLHPSEKSSEEHETNKSFRGVTEASDEIDFVKEIDKELIELDVVRVLEKQDTHDLYCPNCNSCITRKVILRKRKRKFLVSGGDPKLNQLETVVASELDGISANATNAADISLDGSTEPVAEGYNSVREREVFRCLSCFSFFLPSGPNENLQSPQPISAVKKNWISSIFASSKEEMSIEQEAAYSSEASQHSVIVTEVDIQIEDTLKSDNGAFSLAVPDALSLQDTQVTITKDPAKSSAMDVSLTTSALQGSDTIITIKGGHVEPAVSQEAQYIITSSETVPLIRTESALSRGFRGLELIKSMVYGGLMESIASLSIVSSAAGAEAATLNILALGLANLVGGLILITHNLWELKKNQPNVASDQLATRLDQYQELLGRRENFWIHATVAILSFLIFGLIPPVVYGFSFRVSDNVDYKLITVGVSSLLCIIILAIEKAYVQRPPKAYIKTVIFYVVMGFMASGVSYAVGDLIKRLMEKFGWFDSTLVLNLPILRTTAPVEPTWGPY